MLGILSDAHGNRPAFDLAIALLKRCGADQLVFLGDAIGYLPTPDVVDSIRDLGANIRSLRGNHEELLLNKCHDPARELTYQHEETRSRMTKSQIDFVQSWPTSYRSECSAGKSLFVHGSPSDHLFGYMYPDTDLNDFRVTEEFVFMGHTHRPFVRQSGGTTYVNVGSCGLPRDQGCFGSAAMFDDQTGATRILRFDIRNASACRS